MFGGIQTSGLFNAASSSKTSIKNNIPLSEAVSFQATRRVLNVAPTTFANPSESVNIQIDTDTDISKLNWATRTIAKSLRPAISGLYKEKLKTDFKNEVFTKEVVETSQKSDLGILYKTEKDNLNGEKIEIKFQSVDGPGVQIGGEFKELHEVNEEGWRKIEATSNLLNESAEENKLPLHYTVDKKETAPPPKGSTAIDFSINPQLDVRGSYETSSIEIIEMRGNSVSFRFWPHEALHSIFPDHPNLEPLHPDILESFCTTNTGGTAPPASSLTYIFSCSDTGNFNAEKAVDETEFDSLGYYDKALQEIIFKEDKDIPSTLDKHATIGAKQIVTNISIQIANHFTSSLTQNIIETVVFKALSRITGNKKALSLIAPMVSLAVHLIQIAIFGEYQIMAGISAGASVAIETGLVGQTIQAIGHLFGIPNVLEMILRGVRGNIASLFTLPANVTGQQIGKLMTTALNTCFEKISPSTAEQIKCYNELQDHKYSFSLLSFLTRKIKNYAAPYIPFPISTVAEKFINIDQKLAYIVNHYISGQFIYDNVESYLNPNKKDISGTNISANANNDALVSVTTESPPESSLPSVRTIPL